MNFDFTAARAFLDHLDGRVALTDVLAMPAYRAVFSHARKFSEGLRMDDVERAIMGEQTNFYGMGDLRSNRERIAELLELIERQQAAWLSEIETAIRRIFPGTSLASIRVCPIIGYDAGIGHDNHVCMNINWTPYHERPMEFLYTATHEVFHTIYEQIHDLPDFEQVNNQESRLDFFYTMLQNEGGAVFAPLGIRRRNHDMGNNLHRIFEDYLVLQDDAAMEHHIARFLQFEQRLWDEPNMTRAEYTSLVFGPERLTYRVGCGLLQRIEAGGGISAVREALQMPASEFVEHYRRLLK